MKVHDVLKWGLLEPVYQEALHFNYLRLTKRPVGLLINFGNSSLQGERYAFIEEANECILLDKDMNLLIEEEVDSDYEPDWDEMNAASNPNP